MSFVIRDLMIKLLPAGEQGCEEHSQDINTVCCNCDTTAKPPFECRHCDTTAPPDCKERSCAHGEATYKKDPGENPAGAAREGGLSGLARLQQQLRQTLSPGG